MVIRPRLAFPENSLATLITLNPFPAPVSSDLSRDEALFDAALRLSDAAERTAFLENSCADNPEQRTRVETLLAAREEADAFFAAGASLIEASDTIGQLQAQSRTAVQPDGRAVEEESVGQRIGRYKLVQKIGEGGCGAVFLAAQEEPVRRQVALKIIRGGMETKSVIARFEAERQALAMMDHPNIARVFDAGATASGLPFFVMEHVRGVRITDYCDGHRLPLRERLLLFIQVCHAIQHAHQNCIVHGDIKPSNIMIAQHDGVPAPKVIDFGISKATEARGSDKHPHVSVAQLVGTPAYMSPEQVELGGLDIDTRSDIYSLGVLLYELLAGLTPIDGHRLVEAGMAEIQRIFSDERPERPSKRLLSIEEDLLGTIAKARQLQPSKLAGTLQGDLDCIVMRALEHDRRRRYETADALARDVEHFLQNEPVAAHPSSWVYRSSKLVRRNRGAFLAGGAIAIALVLGTGLSTWLFLKERDARQRAVAAEHQQARLRLESETRESLTQAALMVSQERFEEADDLIRGIKLNASTLEGAAVFRAMGEWHALHGRWKLAAERFEVLLRINHLEGADVSSLDYLELGPVLIELGDLEAYEAFRRDAIARFAGKQNPFADRIVKISLLHSADSALLASLEPLARFNEQAAEEADRAGDPFVAAWRSMSIALYAYRLGDIAAAARWAERSLNYRDRNGPRDATARAILSLTRYQQGRPEDARRELLAARSIFKERPEELVDRGSPVHGFWFDWAFAQILIREASALTELPRPGNPLH